MTESEIKPLNWKPDPNVGYTVARRPDVGMNYTFTDVSHATLMHWRDFALQHLYNADRLTRNRYDLRKIQQLTDEAINVAIEANSDPAARNIRLAVLVSSDAIRVALEEILALSSPTGVEMGIFEEEEEAEAWLNRPLTLVV